MSEVNTYTCENCGGEFEWNISKAKMVCNSCGNEKELDIGEVKEYSFNETELRKADVDWSNTVNTYVCKGCGNLIEFMDKNTTATCSYCGADYVAVERHEAGIKPEAIILFRIDKDRVSEIFKKWIKGKIFAPNALKNLYQKDKLIARYIPFWTYDSQTDAGYVGQGGVAYYVTVKRNGKDVTERRVRWYAVSGQVSHFFDDVLVNASPSFAKLVNKCGNFNTQEAIGFKDDFVSGYLTEKYTLKPKEGFETAKGIMTNHLTQMARSQILARYDEAVVHRINVSYEDITFKHLLVPVWASGYYYNNKLYNFIINGQSGKIAGDYPVSPVKVAIAVFIGILVLIGIFIFSVEEEDFQSSLIPEGGYYESYEDFEVCYNSFSVSDSLYAVSTDDVCTG